jgi:hypothetical protein
MSKALKVSKLIRDVQTHLAVKGGVWRTTFDLRLPDGVFDAFNRDLDRLRKMGESTSPPKLEVVEILAKSFVRSYEDDCDHLVKAMTGKPDARFRLADIERKALINFLIWLIRLDVVSEESKEKLLQEVIGE